MKWFIIAVSIAATSSSAESVFLKKYEEGNRFFFFPGDGDGILHLEDAQEPVDEEFLSEYIRNPGNNAYWLFTRTNVITAQVLIPDNVESVNNSNIQFHKNTVVLAHGWNGNGDNTMNKMLKQAFLDDDDVNVIILDWSQLANKNYVTAKKGVPAVGKALGEFISWIVGMGASYNNIHLVGHSLGGHVVGNAGKETGGKVKRITALDPAGPLWNRDESRIVATDGQYVEIIHTNAGLFGIEAISGDADFFPNGGKQMPGCWLPTCSHSKAYEYMAATVTFNQLLANECDTLKDVKQDACSGTLYPMGNSDLFKSRSGIFRVNTAKNYPF